jgi:ATP-dependent helicase/nuclease subunit A
MSIAEPTAPPRRGLAPNPEQRRASAATASAWVAANAGSGKTSILAMRVLRLLLAGATPDRLLCLTFTKAAAAEMANRVLDSLRRWASADDAALAEDLAALEDARPRPEMLARARTLFAAALETPGGLKIQTIHAFCERLLKRFPFEADVPSTFSVLDEQAADALLREARDTVFRRAAAAPSSELGQAMSGIAARAGETRIDTLVRSVLFARGAVRDFIPDEAAFDSAMTELKRALGLAPDISVAAIEAEMLASRHLPQAGWAEASAALHTGSKTDCELADLLAAAASAGTQEGQIAAYLRVFTTEKGEPRSDKRFLTKGLRAAHPDLADALDRERARLTGLIEMRKAATVFEASCGLFRVALAILDLYVQLKRERGALDYDDLIERGLNLLSGEGRAAWVLYKLDYGIDHILVDEAQDTSPAQWRIVTRLAEEFFSGEGARRNARTLFAVGDEKQSIFSFQGADPATFDEMRRHFENRARDAEKPFERVRLALSFRTASEILEAVDTVFGAREMMRGVTADTVWPGHEAHRREAKGLVEIWPLIPPPEREEKRAWDAPFDTTVETSPPVLMAERIARRIRRWMDEGTRLFPGGPPIRPGHVLILVRNRGPFSQGMVRALKRNRVPVAGADRLSLGEHITAMDLTALAEFVLQPADDLTLATVLKSPLIGLDDEDLMRLAPGRQGSLWAALGRAREPAHRLARRRRATAPR